MHARKSVQAGRELYDRKSPFVIAFLFEQRAARVLEHLNLLFSILARQVRVAQVEYQHNPVLSASPMPHVVLERIVKH